MARTKNPPIFDPINREIEAAVGGSMVVVDQWFDELFNLRAERETALDLKDKIQTQILRRQKEGYKPSELSEEAYALRGIQGKINQINKDLRIIDRRIADYYKAAIKDISERLDTFKALPGTSMYAREYRDATRLLDLAKKQAQFSGADIRPKISQLRGAVAALEEATDYARPTGIEVGLTGARGRLKQKKTPRRPRVPVEDQYISLIERWKTIRPLAIKAPEFKSGVTKILAAEKHDTDPSKIRDKEIDFVMGVREIDLFFQVLKRRIERGEPGQERNVENLKHQIDLIGSRLGARGTLGPDQIISKIGKLRRDLLAVKKGTRRSPKDLLKFAQRLEAIQDMMGVKTTKNWSEQDRRTAIAGIRDSQALLAAISTVKLPSQTAKKLGIEPTRKHRIPAKMLKTGNPKKKKRKKKVNARPSSSDSQRAIRRCQKLWEHYCERPGKRRLQDVLKHLDKMKAHGGKVEEESKECMKAAKVEAKRLGLKV